MARVAVLWVDRDQVRLHGSPLVPIASTLAPLGGGQDGDALLFPVRHLDDVCSELDRMGYVWAVEQRYAPRTWAEHMFHGIPPHLWDRAVEALREVFSGPDGDHTSLGLLLFARRGMGN